MREILFRGKRTDNGAWVEGAFCMKDCDEPFGDLLDRPSIIKYDPPCDGFWYRVELETVGQFTGLVDNNGKKVFEGDILHSWSDYHKNYYYQGVVRYGEFNCSCCDGVYGWYLDGGDIRNIDSYEVCGNIYDNPEMLEG